MNRFEEFLMERHAEQSCPSKYIIEDNFEEWLSKLGTDEFLNYGEWFGNMLEKKALEKRIEELQNKVKGEER